MKYEKIMFNYVNALHIQMFYDKEVTSVNISALKIGFIHVWKEAKICKIFPRIHFVVIRIIIEAFTTFVIYSLKLIFYNLIFILKFT